MAMACMSVSSFEQEINLSSNGSTIENKPIEAIEVLPAPKLRLDTLRLLAKEALENNRGVYELVLEKGLISEDELNKLLAPENIVGNF